VDGFNYIVYGASVFAWTTLDETMSGRMMIVGGHLYMCVVRQVDILSYSDTGRPSCCQPVRSGESLDKVDRWTCHLEP